MKLSEAQKRWLKALADGRDPTASFRTQSDYGGATKTVASLWRRGWIDADGITDAGRDVIGKTKPPRVAC